MMIMHNLGPDIGYQSVNTFQSRTARVYIFILVRTQNIKMKKWKKIETRYI